MLDLGHLPSYTKADVQVFVGDSGAVGIGYKTWIKPRGVSMVSFLLVGCGGGGQKKVHRPDAVCYSLQNHYEWSCLLLRN